MRLSAATNRALWVGGFVLMAAMVTGGAWWLQSVPAVDRVEGPVPAALPPAEKASSPQSGTGELTEEARETKESGFLPRIDEVRQDADGIIVVAGRVAPFADVVLRLDGLEFARTSADDTGAFAAVAALDSSGTARVLTLIQVGEEGGEILSPDELILAPVRRLETASADSAADPTATEDSAEPEPEADGVSIAGEPIDATEPASGEAEQRLAVVDTRTETPEVGTSAAKAGLAVPFDPPGALDTTGESGSEPQTVEAEVREEASDAIARDNFERGTLPAARVQENDPANDGNPELSEPPLAAQPKQAAPEVATWAPAQAGPSETSGETVTRPDVVSPARAPVSRPQANPARPAAPAPGAGQVAILRSNEEGVSVIRPADPRPQAMGQIALDSISYSASGDVELQGRAQTAAQQVRVYLDNRPVAALDVNASGQWRGSLPAIDTGIYTLRIDEIDAAGSVTSRIETPFQREAPEVLAAAAQDRTAKVGAVTVQKGDTLWAISRERYGEGTLYVRVFEANRSSIRNPDLIYPGQVFALPGD